MTIGNETKHSRIGKKVLAVVLALAVMLSMFAVAIPSISALRTSSFNNQEEIYIDTGSFVDSGKTWASDGAQIRVYTYYSDSDNNWNVENNKDDSNVYNASCYANAKQLTKVADNIYKFKIDRANVGYVKVLRLNSSASELWNSTSYMYQKDKGGNNCIKITGWNNSAIWSSYTPSGSGGGSDGSAFRNKEKIYINTGNFSDGGQSWTSGNADIRVYTYYADSDDNWNVENSKDDNDIYEAQYYANARKVNKVANNIYEFEIDRKGVGYVKILRLDPTGTTKWDVTGFMYKKDQGDNNCIEITGWGSAKWSKYSPEQSKSSSTSQKKVYNATVGSSVKTKNNLLLVDSTFYDYYTDEEYINQKWRSNSFISNHSYWEPYEILNNRIAQDARNNGVKYPLYFGNFYNDCDDEPKKNDKTGAVYPSITDGYTGSYASNLHNFYNAPNNSSRLGGVSRAVQGLAASQLDSNNMIKYSTGGLMPFFNADWVTSNDVGVVVNSKFPMRKVTENGVTTYKFESMDVDEYDQKKTTPGYNPEILDNVWFTGYESGNLVLNYSYNDMNTAMYDASSNYSAGDNHVGFFPFDYRGSRGSDHTNDAYDFGFGMRVDIDFNVAENGLQKNSNGQDVAQTFSFTGDDDVWVYIDGQLVLDLGGDHKLTKGTIDFSKLTATASSGTYDINTKAQTNSKTTNFPTTFATANGRFDNQDSTQTHTLTMFYMERGMIESNLSFEFNFAPVTNQLIVDKTVETTGINSGITGDTTSASYIKNADSFTYGNHQNKEYEHSVNGNANTGTNGTFTLKNGQKATFEDQFEVGDALKFTESIPSTAKFVYDTDKTTWTVTDIGAKGKVSDPTVASGTGLVSNFTYKTKLTGDFDETRLQLSYVNKLKTAPVTISKVTDSNVAGDKDETFSAVVSVDIGNGYKTYPLAYSYKDGSGAAVSATMPNSGTVTLKHNRTITIPNLPVNAKVKIVETGKNGLNPSYSPSNGEVTVAENGSSITVTNSRGSVTPATITLEANKTLIGGTLAANQFTFDLYQDGYKILDTTNNAQGMIQFVIPEVQFNTSSTTTKTYQYTIKERVPADSAKEAGMTYSTNEVYASVTVRFDAATNTYIAGNPVYTYKNAGENGFTNYKSGVVKISKDVTKNGKKVDPNDAGVKNEVFKVKVTVTYPSGLTYNQPISYEYEDGTAGGTSADGIIPIKAGQTIVIKGLPADTKINVTEVEKDSKYSEEITGGNGNAVGTNPQITVTNKELSTDKIQFTATKSLTTSAQQANLEAKDFTFVLSRTVINSDGSKGAKTEVGRKSAVNNNGTTAVGTVTFNEIEFTAADAGKTYEYEISEVVDNRANVKYSTNVYKATVKVTLDSNNAVQKEVTYQGSSEFTNDYNTGSVKIVKVLRDSYGNVITNSNIESDKAKFNITATITYPNGTNTTRTLQLANGEEEVISNLPIGTTVAVTETLADGSIYTVSYKVGETQGNTATVSGTQQTVTVTNTRKAPANTQRALEVTKKMTGATLVNEAFSFTLSDSTGVLQTKKNGANGKVSFDAITYTAADAGKTYTYTIAEVKGNDGSVDYSETVITAKVKVNYSIADNTLSTTVTYTDADGNVTTEFENTFKTGDVTITKVVKQGDATVYPDTTFNATVSISYANAYAGYTLPLVYDYVDYDKDGNVVGRGSAVPMGAVEGVVGGTVVLKAGRVISIKGLPQTATVTVTEEYGAEYVCVISDNNGSAVGQGLAITVTNKEQVPDKLSFEATKKFDAAAQQAGLKYSDYSFILKKDGVEVETVAADAATGVAKFKDLSYTVADAGKTYTYTIEEVKGTAANVNYAQNVYKAVVEVTKDANNKITATIVSKEGTPEFTNTYNTGSVKIVKVLRDSYGNVITNSNIESDKAKFDITATITYPNGTNTTRTLQLANGEEEVISNLPIGTTVAVTETLADGSIYTASYKVGETQGNTATVSGTQQTITVTNTRKAPANTQAVLKATKILQGATLEKDAFTFNVLDADNKVVATAANLADGTVTFPAFAYTAADAGKSFEYTIKEVKNADDAEVTYSEVEIKATVKVVYNMADNTLSTEVTYSNAEGFVNSFNTSSVTITKLVTDNSDNIIDSEDTFTATVTFTYEGSYIGYTLPLVYTYVDYDKDGNEVAKGYASIGEDGTIELKGGRVITIDGLPVNTKVAVNEQSDVRYATVYSNGTGVIRTGDSLTITNKLQGSGSIQLKATKRLTENAQKAGVTLENTEFKFVLAEGETVIDEQTAKANGSVDFKSISYNSAGKHEYTIYEVPANNTNIIYDDTRYTVTVDVVKNETTNTLEATAVYPEGGAVFTNDFKTGKVEITKKVVDHNGNAIKTDDEFSALVEISYDGSENYTTYGNITLASGKTVTIDNLPVVAKVKVTEASSEYYVATYNPSNVVVVTPQNAKMEVTNTLQAPASVTISAQKTLKDAKFENAAFTFELQDENEKVIQSKGVKADGSITFDAITYTEKGTYTYYIKEVNKGDNDIIYDEAAYKAVVTVDKDADNNKLVAQCKYYLEDSEVTAVAFTNEIKTGSVTIHKTNQADDNVENVKFALYKVDSDSLTRADIEALEAAEVQTTNADGVVKFENLKLFKTNNYSPAATEEKYQWYCVAEVEAADGYTVNGELHFFRLPIEGNYDITYSYVNGKIVSPVTGGTGMDSMKFAGICIIGFALLAFAGYVVYRKKTSKKLAHIRTK